MARFYQQCLSREPDRQGLESWVARLLSGSITGADLAEGFIFSQEFIGRQTSDVAFLNVMYRAFFNREPDGPGVAYWLGRLQDGTSRRMVLESFTHSVEFSQLSRDYGIVPYQTPQSQVEAFVTRFYQQCLNRQPEPSGLAYWANELLNGAQTGAEVAHGFIFSEEFTNRRTSDEDFLRVLYRAFFNREPDADGWNFWLGQLRGGVSREQAVYGFTHSPEFVTLCQRYGIRPY